MFLVSIPDRTQETLETMIKRWVLPQTIIITDSWKSYAHLDELGFYHYEVNHSQNFVSPQTGAHTQRIEGMWRWLRTQCHEGGSGYPDLDFRLSAFLYRRCINQDIEAFIKDLGKVSHSEVMRIIGERKLIREEIDAPTTADDDSSTSKGTSDTSSQADQDSQERRRRLVAETLISSPTKKKRTLNIRKQSTSECSASEEEEADSGEREDPVVFDTISHIRESIRERRRRGRSSQRKTEKKKGWQKKEKPLSRSVSVRRRLQRELKKLESPQ